MVSAGWLVIHMVAFVYYAAYLVGRVRMRGGEKQGVFSATYRVHEGIGGVALLAYCVLSGAVALEGAVVPEYRELVAEAVPILEVTTSLLVCVFIIYLVTRGRLNNS